MELMKNRHYVSYDDINKINYLEIYIETKVHKRKRSNGNIFLHEEERESERKSHRQTERREGGRESDRERQADRQRE